jgi:hypothetical protein
VFFLNISKLPSEPPLLSIHLLSYNPPLTKLLSYSFSIPYPLFPSTNPRSSRRQDDKPRNANIPISPSTPLLHQRTHILKTSPKNGRTSFRSILNRADDDGGAMVRGPISQISSMKGPDICIITPSQYLTFPESIIPFPYHHFTASFSRFSPLRVFPNRIYIENSYSPASVGLSPDIAKERQS